MNEILRVDLVWGRPYGFCFDGGRKLYRFGCITDILWHSRRFWLKHLKRRLNTVERNKEKFLNFIEYFKGVTIKS